MSDLIPSKVRIVEVGPRDGLQNEAVNIPVETKVELIHKLAEAGLPAIEAASFVSPKWVPQMAGSDAVMRQIQRKPDVSYSALTPNMRGLEAAMAAGVTEVAVFAAASESFSQKNINCSIEESIERYSDVLDVALNHNLKVRGYVSCVLGCPYEGDVDPNAVADVSRMLFDKGCYEVSLGDTIGTGTPMKARKLVEKVSDAIPVDQIAVHFHDTYGQALANIYASLQYGVSVVDSSVAGLGGCPYAKGAAGNVATEDVVFMLNGMGIDTGVDMDKLMDASLFICDFLKRPPASKAGLALAGKRKAAACP